MHTKPGLFPSCHLVEDACACAREMLASTELEAAPRPCVSLKLCLWFGWIVFLFSFVSLFSIENKVRKYFGSNVVFLWHISKPNTQTRIPPKQVVDSNTQWGAFEILSSHLYRNLCYGTPQG